MRRRFINRACGRFAGVVLTGLAFFLAGEAKALAQQNVYTWTGGGGNDDWNTAANWSDGVPASGGTTKLVFGGSTRTTSVNNLGDWNLSIGQLEFASGAAAFTLSGNTFGFTPYDDGSTESQWIFQNSSATQTIAQTFAVRPGSWDVYLNAGDLLISSNNVYFDSAEGFGYTGFVEGDDNTRRTLQFSGNMNDPNGFGYTLEVWNNKRLLITGTCGINVDVTDGVLELSGAGVYSPSVPEEPVTLGQDIGDVALWLNTAGSVFSSDLQFFNDSYRQVVGGLNTSGTITYSGAFYGSSDAPLDLKSATGGAVNFSGPRNIEGSANPDTNTIVNRPDGATAFGGTVILSGTTNSTGYTALEAGTLQFSDFNQLSTGHFEFNGAPGVSGTLRYTGGSATTTKTLFLDNTDITGTIDVTEAGTTLNWNPGFAIINQNFAKAGDGTLVFGSNSISGTANVSVSAGKLVLTGSNSYSGGSTVSGGVLEVSAGNSPGGSASGLGSGTVAIGPGGQVTYYLSYSDSHTITNAFSLSGGTLYSEDGINTFSGQVSLASGTSTIAAHYEDTYTFSGGLAGSGNVVFTQAGGTGAWAAPTFVLSAAGSNTGSVRVTGSSGGGATKLQIAHVNALQSATLDLATGDKGQVELTVSGTNTYSLGGLQGSRDLAIGANSLSVGGNGGSTVYSGGITGTGGLLKSGTGRLELTGSNAFTGQTTLQAGELNLNGSLASTVVTTAAASTLSGTGSLFGNVTIEGIHSPGNSPGVQTIGGDLTYSGSASSVVWELTANTASIVDRGVSYDGIDVGGNLAFAAPTILSLVFNSAGSTVNWNDSFWGTTATGTNGWLLYDVAGSTTDFSNFSISGTNWLDSLGNSLADVRPDTTFALSQIGSDVYVTLVAVPEPSSVVLLGVGAAIVAAVRQRRRSSRLDASGTSAIER